MLDPAGIMKVLTDARDKWARTRDRCDKNAAGGFSCWDMNDYAANVLDSVIAEMAREIGTEVER